MMPIAGGLIGGVIGGTVSHLFSPALRDVGYKGNFLFPTVMPSVEDCIRAWQSQGINKRELYTLLVKHGVDIEGKGAGPTSLKAWQAILDISWQDLSLDQLFRLFRRGDLTRNQLIDLLIRQGVNVVRDFPQLEALIRNPLQLQTSMQLLWRGFSDRTRVERDLADIGVTTAQERDGMIEAAYYVPPPGDLIRFMVRDVFDEQVATDNQLDTDFANKFKGKALEWAQWQGVRPEVMAANWRAHWQFPAPQQLSEMQFRLRPGRLQRFIDAGYNPQAVTPERLVKTLQTVDNAPGWINELACLQFHKPGVGEIESLYQRKIITEQEAIEYLKDLGYDNSYARQAVKLFDPLIDQRSLRRLYKEKQITVAEMAGVYELHGYSPELARKLAVAIAKELRPDAISSVERVSVAAIRDGLDIGAIDEAWADIALVPYGLDAGERATVIQSVRVENRIRRAKRVLNAAGSNYTSGAWNRSQTESALRSAGFTAEKIAEHLTDWDLDLQSGRRKLSTSEILNYLERGIIVPIDAITYLANLGYSDTDVNLMLDSVDKRIDIARQKIAARELAVQERAAKEAKRAEEKAAAKAAAYERRREAEAARTARGQELEAKRARESHGTKSEIVAWAKAGLITPADAFQRLLTAGEPDDDARLSLALALGLTVDELSLFL